MGDEGGGVALHAAAGCVARVPRAHPGPVLAVAERSLARPGRPSLEDSGGFRGTLLASVSRGQVQAHYAAPARAGDGAEGGAALTSWAAAEGLDLGVDARGSSVALSPSGGELVACGASGALYAFRVVPPPAPASAVASSDGAAGSGGEGLRPGGSGVGEDPGPDGAEEPAAPPLPRRGRLVPLLAVGPGEASRLCPAAGGGACTALWSLRGHGLSPTLLASGVYVWWEGCSQLVLLELPAAPRDSGPAGEPLPPAEGEAGLEQSLAPARVHKAWHLAGAITCSALSKNGVFLACGLARGYVAILDTHCGALVKVVACGGAPVTSVCFTEAGSDAHLCAGDRAGQMFIHDIENGRSSSRVLSKSSFGGLIAGIDSMSALLVAFQENGEAHLQVFNSLTKKHVAELKPSRAGHEFASDSGREPHVRMSSSGRYLLVLERAAVPAGEAGAGAASSPPSTAPPHTEAREAGAGAGSSPAATRKADSLLVYDLAKRFARTRLMDAPASRGESGGAGAGGARNPERKIKGGNRTKAGSTMAGLNLNPRMRGHNSTVVVKPARASMVHKHRQATVFARRGASTTALDFEEVEYAIPCPREPEIRQPSSTSSLLKGAAARQKRMDIRQEELTAKFLYDSAVKPCL